MENCADKEMHKVCHSGYSSIPREQDLACEYMMPVRLLPNNACNVCCSQKLEASRTFAENNNLPVLTKVLYPRSKGCIERIYVRSQGD